ncbi:BREX-3 system P-loop-containing protein BrxF [Desulfobacter sp.]
MVEPVQNQIIKILPTAEELYSRLILVVGESGSGKTAVLSDIAKESDTQVINLNLILSERLLELTAKQRILRLPKIISALINDVGPLVILDNNEILFDEGLKQDPLKLLQGLSRNRTIVASWNGKYEKNKLIYAEPDHPEYRTYDAEDTIIIGMDGTSTIDIE